MVLQSLAITLNISSVIHAYTHIYNLTSRKEKEVHHLAFTSPSQRDSSLPFIETNIDSFPLWLHPPLYLTPCFPSSLSHFFLFSISPSLSLPSFLSPLFFLLPPSLSTLPSFLPSVLSLFLSSPLLPWHLSISLCTLVLCLTFAFTLIVYVCVCAYMWPHECSYMLRPEEVILSWN